MLFPQSARAHHSVAYEADFSHFAASKQREKRKEPGHYYRTVLRRAQSSSPTTRAKHVVSSLGTCLFRSLNVVGPTPRPARASTERASRTHVGAAVGRRGFLAPRANVIGEA